MRQRPVSRKDYRPFGYCSSSFSTPSPMMSETSGSPSSCSSMKAASSRVSSASTSSSSPSALTPATAGFLPCCSASASSSETNSASAVSGAIATSSTTGAGRRHRRRGGRLRSRTHRRHHDGDDLAGIRGNHRVLVEIVELAPRFRTNALGAEFCFRHGRAPREKAVKINAALVGVSIGELALPCQ